MHVRFVDLKAQYQEIKPEIDQAIQKVLDETAFIGGKHVQTFCQNFANYNGVKHAVGVGNGTDAITLALKALDLPTGSEVITVANSFFATAEAATNAGLKVKFVDCKEDTYNINPELIESAITPKTKVIIPVHLYGQPAEMDSIVSIAKKHNLFVVEDCAQAHGAKYKNQMVGTFGDLACYSFYPGKNLGAYGDAGMVVTNSDDLAEKLRMLADHGSPRKYEHTLIGQNSRLDGLQAAILDVKLKYLEKWTTRRREVAHFYDEALRSFLQTPTQHPETYSVYHLYIIQVEERERFMSYLKENNIDCGLHYPTPLPATKAYQDQGYSDQSFPVSQQLTQKIVSLPMHGNLTDDHISYTVEKISHYFK